MPSASEKPDLDARVGLLIPVIKGWMTERVPSTSPRMHCRFMAAWALSKKPAPPSIIAMPAFCPFMKAQPRSRPMIWFSAKPFVIMARRSPAFLDEIDHRYGGIGNTSKCGHFRRGKIGYRGQYNTARIATANIIGSANSPRRPAAAASNYLMLLGTLSGGWLMARAGAAAADAIASGETGTIGNDDFMTIKITTMQIYLTHHLPKLFALARTIADGDAPVLAMKPDWL